MTTVNTNAPSPSITRDLSPICLSSSRSTDTSTSITVKSALGGMYKLQGGGAGSAFKLFEITGSSEVTFMNLNIVNGSTYGGGAAISLFGSGQLTLVNVAFSKHCAIGEGGTISFYTIYDADLVVTNCSFTDISATGAGGAISATACKSRLQLFGPLSRASCL